MKQGGYRKARIGSASSASQQVGFTIVETLIVLAVTGLLFISAVMLVSGRQNKTQFMTGINEISGQISQVANEVSSGYFPDTSDFQCTGNAAPGNLPKVTDLPSGAPGQGQNDSCIFLGKVLYIGMPSSSGTYFYYDSFTIAANRLDSAGGNDVTTLYGGSGANPVVASPHNSKIIYTIHDGVTPIFMYYNGLPANKTSAIGFLSSLGNLDASTGNLSSGSQTVNLYALQGTYINDPSLHDPAAGSVYNGPLDRDRAAAKINPHNGLSAPLLAVSSISICFQSGSTPQSGLITIGNGSNQESVDLTIFSSGNCT